MLRLYENQYEMAAAKKSGAKHRYNLFIAPAS